jgi:hypothetical protein
VFLMCVALVLRSQRSNYVMNLREGRHTDVWQEASAGNAQLQERIRNLSGLAPSDTDRRFTHVAC